MNFIGQAKQGQGNAGTYILTIAVALLSLVVGQIFVEILANKLLGYSFMNIPSTADLNLALALLLIPFGFLLLALFLCVKFLHKRSIVSLFTARKVFDWKRFFISFGIWGGLLIISLALSMVFSSEIEWNFNLNTFLPLLLVSFFILPIQTTAEEAFFRGYLLQGLNSFFKKAWMSLLLTSILFGLLHWSNPEVAKIGTILLIYYISTGLFLGLLALLDDGLELSMGYHAANNIFASLILTNDWQAFQTDALLIDRSEPSFGWEIFFTLLVLHPLLLFVYAKLYKWKNWKGKLLS